MYVANAVYPEKETILKLLKIDWQGPISMVNLLKFRDRAEYPDGRDKGLSGRQAYQRYGEKMLRIVTDNGGKMLFSGPIHGLPIGQVEELWDTFALIEYPSIAKFVGITSLPEVAEIAEHRTAGLAGQLLVLTSADAGTLTGQE